MRTETHTEHHPSCTDYDKSLVWHCHQCGTNESAEDIELHNKRLNEELPKMRQENKRLTDFLKDAAAFIRIANSGKGAWNSNILLATLIHDINGLSRDEECFQPRVSGYAKRERDEE